MILPDNLPNSEAPKLVVPRYAAFVTKGLEQVSVNEIKTIFPQAELFKLTEKYVIFSAGPVTSKEITRIRTCDDIHYLLDYAEVADSLDEELVLSKFPSTELANAKSFIRMLRSIGNTFSVTVSKHKNDLIDVESLKIKLAKKIADLTGEGYTELDHSNFDIRINVESSHVLYSVRIPKTSLYVRSYRKCEREGKLKPPVAASMCILARPKKGEKLVDNFCGTGTILCEGKMLGLDPYGGDISKESVDCARINLGTISPDSKKNLKVLDASSSKWPDNFFDIAVSNYPWGHQVTLERATKMYAESISEYARILKDNGRIVLLGIKSDIVVKHLKKNFPHHVVRQLRIGFSGAIPWVIYALPDNQVYIDQRELDQ